jgi:hypothetical protein
MVDYGGAIKKGFKFGFTPKRWLPFFVLDIIFISSLLAITLSSLEVIFSSIINAGADPLAILSLLGYGAAVIAGFVIWGLIRIWVQGAVIHQSYKEKEFDKSWGVAYKKYLSILAAIIIIGIIASIVSTVVGLIPYIGWALSIIASIVISLAFFFVLQEVIVNNKGFYQSIKNSYYTFKRKPFEVFIAWLLIAILTIIIVGIFSIPAVALLFSVFLGSLITGAVPSIETVIPLLQTYLLPLIITGVIFVIGLAISQTFALKAQTELYLQLRKKKLGL